MTTTAQQKTQLGMYGETCAARHLTRNEGMVVLDRNWRCDLGEIDLVLRDRHVLVVCEVKTRTSERFGSALEAVSEGKAARLRVLAHRWCEDHDVRPGDLRIDLVGVLLDGPRIVRLDHSRGI
ncbi:MAG TPA: YraN family protein [Nocardioidaceae bacterium]|nr:YraN family protein [Nocardioidaceae bacterium]